MDPAIWTCSNTCDILISSFLESNIDSRLGDKDYAGNISAA